MYKAQALLSNFKQMTNQVIANRARASGDSSIDSHWREQKLQDTIKHIEQLLNDNKIDKAIKEAEKAIPESKEALYYYRQAQRNQLIMYLTLMWLGWIVLLVLKLIGVEKQNYDFNKTQKSQFTLTNIVFFIALLILLVEHAGK